MRKPHPPVGQKEEDCRKQSSYISHLILLVMPLSRVRSRKGVGALRQVGQIGDIFLNLLIMPYNLKKIWTIESPGFKNICLHTSSFESPRFLEWSRST
jgi:hypothetical protein